MASVAQFLRSKDSQTVWSTQPSASVYDAIAIMAHRHVGALIVAHEGRVAGIGGLQAQPAASLTTQ